MAVRRRPSHSGLVFFRAGDSGPPAIASTEGSASPDDHRRVGRDMAGEDYATCESSPVTVKVSRSTFRVRAIFFRRVTEDFRLPDSI